MLRSHVLLVEDDSAVRRFVKEALKDLDIELHEASSVALAQEALERNVYQLVIADLNFPQGESGLEFVQKLAQAQRQSGPKIVVYSGGLHAAVRERLQSAGVWRCLAKPSSVSEVQAIVREALNIANWPEGPVMLSAESAQGELAAHEKAAVETYFDGDQAFYTVFRESAVQQFSQDLAQGDTACAQYDAMGLRRVAHSLKSVLQTLGYADHSLCAKGVEKLAQEPDWAAAVTGWQELRSRMVSTFQLV